MDWHPWFCSPVHILHYNAPYRKEWTAKFSTPRDFIRRPDEASDSSPVTLPVTSRGSNCGVGGRNARPSRSYVRRPPAS